MFFFSSRRRHTRYIGDWSSDVCSSDLIGAKRRDINMQFLIEAVMLTFIGGFVGVVLGWAISFLVTQTGIIQTQVSLVSVLLAFGVSAAIGIVRSEERRVGKECRAWCVG